MIDRGLRPAVALPIKIQRGSEVFLGCTLDVSKNGIKIQTEAELQPKEEVIVSHDMRKMKFRVVWTKRKPYGFVAGLVSLVQPLNWAQVAIKSEPRH